MKKSYMTYKRAETEEVSAGLRDDILDITKDVHEIKKDYIRVIQGLEQAFGDRKPLEKILISDLVQMLDINTHEYIESAGLDIRFKSRVDTGRYVVKHYYLMSILRNLVNNAIEASQNTLHPHIELRVEEVENDIHFRVSDNGEGMDSDLMDYVFNPGFSTKFDEGTGDICRGIGLTLVESLVQDTFGGSVNVDSVVGEGTTFTVCIPVEAMEVG
jgi:two-component system sensor histidine kinase YcbA